MQAGVWVDGHVEWVVAHEELERLARQRAELDGREGLALLRALRAEVHRHLGYASFPQYVEKLFGYSPRTTDDKLRTALALEHLSELRAALCEGTLPWSSVRELARVATPDTVHDWLQAARGKTVRQIERLVSGRQPGDRPSEPARPEAHRHILRFDVSAQTYATFREAAAAIRRRSSEPMDDDALLLQMAREILQGPSDTGRSSYQVAITVCERCGRGVQHGAGTDVELGPEVVEMVECDAQIIGRISGATTDDESRHADDHDVELADVDLGELLEPVLPQNDEAHTNLEHDRKSPHEPFPHVGDLRSHRDPPPPANDATARLPKATQAIPPAVRRHVVHRDHGRCVVPGCAHGKFLDVHHLRARAEGGTHEPDNLVVLCAGHHTALHAGRLSIEGRPSTKLRFLRADGTDYTEPPSARTVAASEQVIRGLRRLGFPERDSKRAVARALATIEPLCAETLLRAALTVLSGPLG